MSDAPALTIEPLSPARPNAEQWLYDHSPFGTLATSVLIFLILAACFAGASLLDREPFLDPNGHVAGLNDTVWPALVLSLMLAVVLGTQRFARRRDDSDSPAYGRIFRNTNPAPEFLIPRVRRGLLIATIVGLVVGAGLTAVSVPQSVLGSHPFITAWFFVAESFVSILFARGIVMSARNAQLYTHAIHHNLDVDLLRIDRLSVIGRNGARTALIWFSTAAVICLFFVGDNMAISTFLTMLAAAGMGIWIFMQPMMQVHKRIRAAKEAELDRLRHAIADLCVQAPSDGEAATRLHGLLAYERRIEDVREWPFDQTTALRLSAYVLIPAIPWFGQAIAQYFVERLAQSG